MGGRRRRHTKKSKKHSRRHRRHTRRGGFAPASFSGAVLGANGQPAGAAYGAVGVSGSSANPNASSYAGAPDTMKAYGGGRRRRGRKTRRRMRGGDASPMGGEGHGGMSSAFGGESVGFNAPGAAVHYGVSTRVV